MLKEKLFGKTDAVGKNLGDKADDRKKIIGVIDDIKTDGDYQAPAYGIYNQHDTAAYKWLGKIMVKVSPRCQCSF